MKGNETPTTAIRAANPLIRYDLTHTDRHCDAIAYHRLAEIVQFYMGAEISA